MKTVAISNPGIVEIIETPIPKPKPYQALVKTKVACICNNTDKELVSGHFPGMEDSFPFALGHESIGEVVEIGKEVRNFSVGQKAVSGLVFDDELQTDGLSSGWGGFCEYVLVNDHERMVENSVDNEANGWVEVFEIQTPVINSIKYEDGVLLCTWREVLGAFRDFHLKKGDNVLIYGGGPVGLSFVKLGRLFGLGWIGLVDRHDEKKQLAIQFGANETFDRDDDGLNALAHKDGPHKLDAVIDAVGKPEIIKQSLPLIKRGGSVCVYGFYAGLKEFVVHNSLADFNYNIFVHQWPTRLYEKESQPILCKWIEEGKLSGEEFTSHRFKIDDISSALKAVQERKVIKAILEYN